MGYNRFIWNICLRSLLLAATALAWAFLFQKPEWIFTAVFLFLGFAVQVLLLIRYVSRTNRELANFLMHLQGEDTTQAFSRIRLEKTFQGLSGEFEKVHAMYRKINEGKAQKQALMDVILAHVGTGIIAFDPDGKVQLINSTALKMLALDALHTMETLSVHHPFLVKKIRMLEPGSQEIITMRQQHHDIKLLVHSTLYKEGTSTWQIFSFHNIDREMTLQELQSWNGLVSVLSHELMNTLTPVSTVIHTMFDCLSTNGKEKSPENMDEKDINDAFRSAQLIHNRINSLKTMVQRFRQFSDIPFPEPVLIVLKDFLQEKVEMFRREYPQPSFILDIQPQNMTLKADPELLSLVVENLVKNAVYATRQEEMPEIRLTSFHDNPYPCIGISDNGVGIDPEDREKIFVPFYTTKEGGSGIGLSLSRQIMFMHGGEIVLIPLKKGVQVQLLFPQA